MQMLQLANDQVFTDARAYTYKMETNTDKNVLVLFSGGIDSTSCIHYYQKLGYNVKGLFIDYGQPAANQERIAVNKISDILGIDFIEIQSEIALNINGGFIQGRNLLLFAISVTSFPFTKGIISLGIHSGTNYPDCSRTFVELNQRMLDLYTGGNIILDCPFLDLNKQDIYNYFKKIGIPIEYTYSCELGNEIPCGICLTCMDVEKLKNESKN